MSRPAPEPFTSLSTHRNDGPFRCPRTGPLGPCSAPILSLGRRAPLLIPKRVFALRIVSSVPTITRFAGYCRALGDLGITTTTVAVFTSDSFTVGDGSVVIGAGLCQSLGILAIVMSLAMVAAPARNARFATYFSRIVSNYCKYHPLREVIVAKSWPNPGQTLRISMPIPLTHSTPWRSEFTQPPGARGSSGGVRAGMRLAWNASIG